MKRILRLAGIAAVVAAGIVLAALLAALLAVEPIEAHDRGALALSISGCVVAERVAGQPFPCLAVDPARGEAVIRPPFAASEVLLVSTDPVTGIESPSVLAAGGPSYFRAAWDARRFVAGALPRDPGRAAIGMAVNSLPDRSQDRLHIHVDCMDPGVVAALARYGDAIGAAWTPFPVPLSGAHYYARWASAAEFAAMNPFAALNAAPPFAGRAMADMTLVVAGASRPDRGDGFYLLAADTIGPDRAVGEDLLDHACRIAALG